MLDRAHLFTRFSSAVFVAALALAALTGACSKTEGGSSGAPTSSPPSTSTPAPSASATAATAATAAADAAVAAADTPPTPKEADASTADASATAASASGSAAAGAAPACGTKPLPDCPTQAWMKANMNPAVSASDFPALATALDKVVTMAPAGYPNWASIAKDGAKAARAQDMSATKASCRTCHEQYKEKFKKDTATRTKKI